MLDEPELTGAKPLGPGDIVADRYEVRDELGRGGYAIVYRALDRQTGAVVALKTLRPQAPRPHEVVARFRREVQLVSKLQHPNTVRVPDYGFEPDLFLAMELLKGYPLADVLDGVNGLEPHRAVAIARGVLESLSEAHEMGIVHRDLKPENVFLVQHSDGTESVKVLDFGIAKVLGLSEEEMAQPALTLQGRAMGTPTYMSPEQARGASLTTRSDIYAVAILLYEMLCGVPPFQGKGPMDVMLKHVNADIPPLTVPALQGTLIDRAVRKALAKKPDDRFPTAWEFLAALGGVALRAPGLAPVAKRLPPESSPAASRPARIAGQRPSSSAPVAASTDPAAPRPTHRAADTVHTDPMPRPAAAPDRVEVQAAPPKGTEPPASAPRPDVFPGQPVGTPAQPSDGMRNEVPPAAALNASPPNSAAPAVADGPHSQPHPAQAAKVVQAAVPKRSRRQPQRTASFEPAAADEAARFRRSLAILLTILAALIALSTWLHTH